MEESIELLKKQDNSIIKKRTQGRENSTQRRKFHWWQQRIGWVILIVAVLWVIGGLLQSFVADRLQPEMVHQQIPTPPLDQVKAFKPLHAIFSQHNIKGFRNFRWVEINGKYYYQVKNTFNHLLYYDAITGAPLPEGDQVYAEYLARFFSGDQQSPVQLTFLKNFNSQYPEAHRLLPVYQAAFHRPDGLQVYIETAQSRLSAYDTRGMRALHWIRDTFYPHLLTASAPDALYFDDENTIFGIADIEIETTALPWDEVKAHNASLVKMPQGIFYQLFGYDAYQQPVTYYFHANTGEFLPEGDLIYARYLANKFKNFKTKIDAGVSFSCCLPQDTIPDGTQIRKAGIIATELITRFDSSYQAAHKRLPVVKVTYEKPKNTSFYIETSSSSLAALIKTAK